MFNFDDVYENKRVGIKIFVQLRFMCKLRNKFYYSFIFLSFVNVYLAK